MEDDAEELYEEFTGHEADEMLSVDFKMPKKVMVMGRLDGVLYTATRDGVTESYVHEFEDNAPLLCVSGDGRQILIVGGDYIVTDHGIEG